MRLTTSASSQYFPARPGTQRSPTGLGVQVLLSQVPIIGVNLSFIPFRKMIRRGGNGGGEVEVSAGGQDTYLV
jgi:hypothetical protein